jgi:hypothetical protein
MLGNGEELNLETGMRHYEITKVTKRERLTALGRFTALESAQ